MNDDIICGYYIQRNNPKEKILITYKDKIVLTDMDIIELVLTKCNAIWCDNNRLTKLILPQSCKYIYCSSNKLTQLIIPPNCNELNCRYNELTELILPKTCEKVLCYNNNLPPIIENLIESQDPIKIQLANNLQKQKE